MYEIIWMFIGALLFVAVIFLATIVAQSFIYS